MGAAKKKTHVKQDKKRLLKAMMSKSSTKVASSSKSNPFDSYNNSSTPKHDVINRRIKGDRRNVAAARAMADEKRKKTLLVDFQARDKCNSFKDKRFGEIDADMTLDEKMLIRFQEERKRKLRKHSSVYALGSDDEEDENKEFLTHKGSKIDDYDALNNRNENESDDEDGGELSKQIVSECHFGGGKEEPSFDKYGPNTDTDRKKTHQEIMTEVIAKSKYFKAERQKVKAQQEDQTEGLDATFDDIREMLQFRPTKSAKEDRKPEKDEYDAMTRSFEFEAKVAAADRKMSPEEIALKEKTKLEKLEKERLARMRGEVLEEDKHGELQLVPKSYLKTDDDLDAGCAIDPQFQQYEDLDADEEQDDEEEEDDEEEDDDEEEEFEFESDKEDEAPVTKRPIVPSEMPFIFKCPTSPEALEKLFSKHAKSVEDREKVIERIRQYYNPRLGEENAALIRSFFATVLRRFSVLSCMYATSGTEVDMLGKQLFHMTTSMPEIATEIFRKRLLAMTRLTTTQWPEIHDIMVMRLATQLFPTSDFRHVVVTPIELYLGQCLCTLPIKSVPDATKGLLCAGLSINITSSKDRFSPEVPSFLLRVLKTFSKKVKASKREIPRINIYDMKWANGKRKELAVVHSTCLLLQECAKSYSALAAFPELFRPIVEFMKMQNYPVPMRQVAFKCVGKLLRTIEKNEKMRQPLRLQEQAPKALHSVAPRFDENFTIRKDNDVNRDKAKMKQLQRQVKRERKAAARELRLDGEFLARERQKEAGEAASEKKKRQNEIQGWVLGQNATFNEQVRKGGELLKGGGANFAKRPRVN